MQLSGIGILGGTFDPVHIGHLRMAYNVYKTLKLSEVRLLPCHMPVHRDLPQATAEHRLTMLKLAIENVEGLNVEPFEVKQQKASYTIDTINYLKTQTTQPIFLIIGSDSYQQFHTWQYWQDILQQVQLVVMARPNYKVKNAHIDNLHEKIIIKHGYIDVAAQQIRQIYAQGELPYFIQPHKVIEYAIQNNLYTSP